GLGGGGSGAGGANGGNAYNGGAGGDGTVVIRYKMDMEITNATTISGGDGSDTIYGGAGSDMLYGDGGNDTIYSGSQAGETTVVTLLDNNFNANSQDFTYSDGGFGYFD